ncbi:hypothetical protein ILYODFUR_034019 [Ilyodon furcidens]|uniref:Uncharacterized protein n=1 Tax=Ilyodon furcidens TaxID=33524 RepID=A0ABV0TF82_9TELE
MYPSTMCPTMRRTRQRGGNVHSLQVLPLAGGEEPVGLQRRRRSNRHFGVQGWRFPLLEQVPVVPTTLLPHPRAECLPSGGDNEVNSVPYCQLLAPRSPSARISQFLMDAP